MIGALIGDIAGSRFEFDNYRKKDFQLFHKHCFATDDSIMTLAIGKAILEHKRQHTSLEQEAVFWMQKIGRPYPHCGFGGRFYGWIYSDAPQPYNSFGNGAAMRVSGCGFAASTMEEALQLCDAVTGVTHNHPEGLRGARATTAAIFLAKNGASMEEIRSHITETYYPLNFTIDEIRPTYRFNESCQETVPQAIEAFLESSSFEDAIRTAVSVGGDSDTLAAITGSIAEAFYGVPQTLHHQAVQYLDSTLLALLQEFEQAYGSSVVTL